MKIELTFPNHDKKEYDLGTTVLEVAESISLSLKKATVGAKLNDRLIGANEPILENGEFLILTKKDELALKILNHSAAHLLAYAIQELYPNTKFWVGPAIEEGFYYDMDLAGSVISDQDFVLIEKKMHELSKANFPVLRKEVTAEEAKEIFKANPYKLDLIEKHASEGLTVYTEGEFADLCRGGHVKSTGEVQYFKLLSVSGSYFKGSAKEKPLTRIYGCAFFTQTDLDAYLKLLQERKDRDHRKVGKEQDIFFISKEVGQGLVFMQPKGATIRRTVERYITDKELALGYLHVYTPILANVSLYETSGHFAHYKDSMFPVLEFKSGEKMVLRPMNCPHHMQIFSQKLRSYQELPLRIAELGMMHRYEKSGALTGLERVREMTLNDAHIFVTPKQIKQEFSQTVKLILDCYKDFNIKDFKFRLSYRDKEDKEKYYPDDKMWDMAEKYLKETMDSLKLTYFEAKGEAAFYGPKLDVQIKTAIGHEETLSTVQLDFLLAKRFGLTYVDKDGKEKTPVVIHRGVVSTMERFIAYLLEETKGVFPLWLSPDQIRVIPVNNEFHLKYAKQVVARLRKQGFIVNLDASSEKLGYKIRQSQTQKVNYTLVIGDNEVQNKSVTYRKYGETQQTEIKTSDFIKLLKKEIKTKGLK